MIREIEINPVKLAKPCKGVPIGDERDLVIQDLIDTAKHWQAQEIGCAGLAAIQIGYQCRIVVVYHEGRFIPMVSPEITSTSCSRDMITKPEGCLSRPGVSRRMKRHKKITVVYWDEFGDLIEQKFTKKIARVVQHEIQHLDGVTI